MVGLLVQWPGLLMVVAWLGGIGFSDLCLKFLFLFFIFFEKSLKIFLKTFYSETNKALVLQVPII